MMINGVLDNFTAPVRGGVVVEDPGCNSPWNIINTRDVPLFTLKLDLNILVYTCNRFFI